VFVIKTGIGAHANHDEYIYIYRMNFVEVRKWAVEDNKTMMVSLSCHLLVDFLLLLSSTVSRTISTSFFPSSISLSIAFITTLRCSFSLVPR
jgi:hypothetical protein